MAQLEFLAGDSYNIVGGSGLGFYGAAFSASVAVGAYQQTTFITNSNGTAQGPAADNVKWLNAQSGTVNSATSGINLLAIPNGDATLNIRFSHTSAVQTQNAKLYIYDRLSSSRPASGVTTKVAEIIHPNPAQVPGGSGDNVWHTFSGSIADASHYMDLVPSPGSGGAWGNGVGDRLDMRHDWYVAISASPDTIGSKQYFGLLCSLEYL